LILGVGRPWLLLVRRTPAALLQSADAAVRPDRCGERATERASTVAVVLLMGWRLAAGHRARPHIMEHRPTDE